MPQMIIQPDPEMDQKLIKAAEDNNLNSKADMVILIIKKYFDDLQLQE